MVTAEALLERLVETEIMVVLLVVEEARNQQQGQQVEPMNHPQITEQLVALHLAVVNQVILLKIVMEVEQTNHAVVEAVAVITAEVAAEAHLMEEMVLVAGEVLHIPILRTCLE